MTNSVRYSLGFGLLMTVLITACSTINVKAAWKNPAYLNHPQKIMVIGLSKSTAIRRVFEDEFVRQIRIRGADAIASYTVLPDTDKNDQEAIAEKLTELGADTVLITRLVSKRNVRIHVHGTTFIIPPFHEKWRNYYTHEYQIIRTPGYDIEEEFALLETNLYDAASDDLIWTAWSEAGIAGATQSLIKSYIGAMVKNMADQKLLGK